jgi:ribosomal-protein-alanine N-acetyltransferase
MIDNLMNQTFSVTFAVPSDLDGIMQIENAAFPQGIRESKEVFRERLRIFPAGNTILLKDEAANENKTPVGYFCSELWDQIPPPKPEFYALEHSITERHKISGAVLYISSLAIMPHTKGQGRFLFTESIKMIRAKNPQIRTIVLLVNEKWLPARHIYETEGFRYTKNLPSFFSKIDTNGTLIQSAGLLMQKDFL